MLRLLACLVVACCVGPAAACLWDKELPSHEREFRSQYRNQTNPPPAPSADLPEPPSHPFLMGSGGILLLGALGLVVVGRRAKG